MSATMKVRDGSTVEIVREFPKADPVAYPEGLYAVAHPGHRGVFFIDRLGYVYRAPKEPNGFMVKEPNQ